LVTAGCLGSAIMRARAAQRRSIAARAIYKAALSEHRSGAPSCATGTTSSPLRPVD
jgi:hypothetical protein